jgi:LAO/AO transport system kinase
MREDIYKDWLNNRKMYKKGLSADQLFERIIKRDNYALSSAITLIESNNETDKVQASKLISLCTPFSGKSLRIGITGVPGVGKSTFIEAVGCELIASGKRVAVLSIDPSSEKTQGSILGDKTRMERLTSLPNAFIRPTASGSALGGVARHTRESILLCEAAGYDVILIETVGVGQSETMVHAMVDFFLLLMLSGAGDELQGIKRGIMEMADAIVITKSDGENLSRAKEARQIYQRALHYFPSTESAWVPQVLNYSFQDLVSVQSIISLIQKFQLHQIESGYFESNRQRQAVYWMREALLTLFDGSLTKLDVSIRREIENKVFTGEVTPFEAADQLYTMILENTKNGK